MPPAASREKKAAFEALFHEHYRPVVNLFARKGCSLEDSKDLASETFARAYGAFSGFRGEAKSSTWLHTIANNVWLNRVRDSSAAKRDGVEVPIPIDGHMEPAFQSLPRDHTIVEERRRLLKSAIDGLPTQMRRCVWLRVYQDRSYREIAEVLDVTVGTAKSQVSMAKARLRSLLAEHYPELEDDPDD